MMAGLGFKDVFIYQICCHGTATVKPWKNEEKFLPVSLLDLHHPARGALVFVQRAHEENT